MIDGNATNGLIIELEVNANSVFEEITEAENNTIAGYAVVQLEGLSDNEWISADLQTDTAQVVNAG